MIATNYNLYNRKCNDHTDFIVCMHIHTTNKDALLFNKVDSHTIAISLLKRTHTCGQA